MSAHLVLVHEKVLLKEGYIKDIFLRTSIISLVISSRFYEISISGIWETSKFSIVQSFRIAFYIPGNI